MVVKDASERAAISRKISERITKVDELLAGNDAPGRDEAILTRIRMSWKKLRGQSEAVVKAASSGDLKTAHDLESSYCRQAKM